ncbi:hypothetical protein [Planococcus sp. 107-1]|uniref:hypothetical protein n=1 Tax=Planococcus sp. 107-1 TaxID=2908840 RepID=UPI001F2C4413|nr:hypothetical protein [Planococcus sp. 107-1]UJF27932.1 hypothetical protein L0M13_05915 [Planococcus sp. 107-1]
MCKEVKYKVVQSFVVSHFQNELIETRYIKRIIEENENETLVTKTQILKSNIKRVGLAEIPVKNHDRYFHNEFKSFEVFIKKDDFETYMQSSFDLFKLALQ